VKLNELTEFEIKLHNTKGVYIIKEAKYSEKLTCGLFMSPSTYTVFEEKYFTPSAV
jgi:hypothetical protein